MSAAAAAPSTAHQSVLLQECVTALNVVPNGRYVDATYGRGGHSAAILAQLGDDGRLLALDRDPEAVADARHRFADDPRFEIEQARFGTLEQVVERRGLLGLIDGLLLDLGVSSPQLDQAERGFSFMSDGPLDMRMDPTEGESAAQWLARAEADEIADVLYHYGEERHSRRIARAICAERVERPLTRTRQLAELVARVSPGRDPHKHPATRTFQAIRIFINRELEELQAALGQSLRVLANGARLAVISFHSLEDRVVKRFMRDAAQGQRVPKGVPVTDDQLSRPTLRLVGKAIAPGEDEIAANPRARSARLRVAERIS